jgi:hypothetical protein
MTPDALSDFERRLVDDLRAYADVPGLAVPPAHVVADVTARTAPRRRWLVPAGLAAGVLVAVAGLAGIQALNNMASRPAEARVEGLTYGLAIARGLAFEEGDLTAYGQVSSSESAWFADRIAYAVDGVDPDDALVVRLRPGLGDDDGPWGEWALLTRGAVTRPLCPYYDPLSPFAPPECVEDQP